MKQRILAAMTVEIQEQFKGTGDYYCDNYGDGRDVTVDGPLNMNKVAEAIARVVGPKTETITIAGEPMAALMASRLVAMSQWFQFEPMPDGKYEFTIKQELLQRLINNGYVQMQEVNNAGTDTHAG